MSCPDADAAEASFVAPTEKLLNNLGPGCFIRVRDGENCFWAEIASVEGAVFTGYVHRELATPKCQAKPATAGTETFSREQIVALGCDRYCWC